MQRVHIYIEAERVLRKTQKWYGYVLELEGTGATREGFGQIDGTYHLAAIRATLEAMRRITKPCEIVLHMPDQTMVRHFRSLDQWAERKFMLEAGEPMAHREVWEEIWNASKPHTLSVNEGKHAYSDWIQAEIRQRKKG